jgi:hypothetical protein
MRRVVVVLALLLAAGNAPGASILDGDPVDPGTGRAYPVLPGVPLILPQPDGKFDPPIVVPGTVGDVDLVVRAATTGIGPAMPPPVSTPPVAVSGGTHVVPGSEIPFTVIASTGGAGAGAPLGGTSLDGIPVVVSAFADLDGDGVVGPTAADGTADDARERQEALFLVGRQVAVFDGGIAEGALAVWKGAPASAGGLTVVLTAMAYVGPFSPTFFEGNVPDGPGVATLLPFFPRLDPKRVVDGEGRGGPADPDERLGFELEPAFDVPVNDPVLGTPFALPTSGASPTIDRAVVVGGPVSRARFLRPAGLTGFGDEVESPVRPGAGGTLLEPQPAISLPDDGPGGGVTVQLVPVDRLDNVTDPAGAAATLVAGPGLAIVAPDGDGDPAREAVTLADAAGVAVTVGDAGGVNDSGATSTLSVVMGGVPVESLAVSFTPGAGGGGGSIPPAIRGVAVDGAPAIVRNCRARRTLAAVVDPGTGGTPSVTATLSFGGTVVRTLRLTPTAPPAGITLPPGPVHSGRFTLDVPSSGVLDVVVMASTVAGSAAPLAISLPVVTPMPPTVLAPELATTSIPVGVRSKILASALVIDDCPLRSVKIEADLGPGFRRAGRLRDDGRRGDAVARDGRFTGKLLLRPKQARDIAVRVVARNKAKLAAAGPPSSVAAR